MSQLQVRDATTDDTAALVEFVLAEAREAEARVLDAGTVAAAVTAGLRDPALARYWLIVDNDTALGAISVVREWSDWRNTAYWWIQFAFIVPAARGQGLLAQLVDEVRRTAAAVAVPELRLYVHPGNARAIRAYERIGFLASDYRMMTLAIAPGGPAATALDDDALWRGFHDRTLPAAQWTHAAHLRVAWLHLARYDLDEAHLRMRAGILRLNLAHGLIETAERGYHETLTRVWLRLVRDAHQRLAGATSTSVLGDPELGRNAPLAFYTRARLFSREARAVFVSPDLAPLP